MFKLWTTAVLGSTLVLAACNTLPMGTDNPHQASLKDTAWQLSQLNGKAVNVDPTAHNHPHLLFSSELRVSGSTGCNRLMGQAKVTGHSLSLAPIASTKMGCIGENLETPFVEALNSTQQYQIKQNQLILKNASGKILAVLTAKRAPLR